MKHYLGIDIGSVAIKAVVIEESSKEILWERYLRLKGEPRKTAENIVKEIQKQFKISAVFTTGSGGRLIEGKFVNEIIALATASSMLMPGVKTILEMGGEDAKLLQIEDGKLADFSTNTVCAAGTGSFLDQQATRLGYSIEEFSSQALKSKHPPRIAGRCTVFAKSDMIHLQQKGTPDYEIIAGLCLAVARNFTGTVGRGKKWEKPVAFLGGVAANRGMVKAFESVLKLSPSELMIPKHFASHGAIGAVYESIFRH